MKQYLRERLNNWIKRNSGKGYTNIPLARKTYDWLVSKSKPEMIEINGCKMKLDKKDVMKLSVFGKYEPFCTEIVKQEVREGMNAINIGAHVGYYSLLLAKLVGRKGSVTCFEPFPDNFDILKENIEMNNFRNAYAFRYAVSDVTDVRKLYVSSFSSGMNSLVNNEALYPKGTIDVQSIKLDDFFKDDRIDFILMDVEGGEQKVLEGMEKILRKYKPTIIAELVPNLLIQTSFHNVYKFMRKFGYEFYSINEKEKKLKLIKDDIRFIKEWKPDIMNNFLLK